MVADQVRISQNDLREWFNTQLNVVKRQFIIPGVIDNNGTYSDFKDFVNKITKSKSEREAEGERVTEILAKTDTIIKAMQADLKKKIYEIDQEKAEKKLKQIVDGKFVEVKETQRVDRMDYNQKLATFKIDVSEMTFERDTLDFFKKQIYPNWGSQIKRTREAEATI